MKKLIKPLCLLTGLLCAPAVLLHAECLESLCLVERQRTVHVARADDVGFQLFIYLGMKQNSRGTRASVRLV